MQRLQTLEPLAQALGTQEMNDSYKVLTLNGQDSEVGPYLGFILSNWMTTLRYTNDWFKLIDEDIYYTTYSKVIRAILDRPQTQVRLAVLSDNLDVCIGFSVCELQILHYCFVKREGRKQGIATSLVPKDIHTITHLTVPGVVIWTHKMFKSKTFHVVFNPFL